MTQDQTSQNRCYPSDFADASPPADGAGNGVYVGCLPECWTVEHCGSCKRPKAPTGRSIPLNGGGAWCDRDCPGYGYPRRHLWDEHDDARHYTDPEGWAAHEAACARCGPEDDSPQAVTYQESLLEGANPDEGFYE